jgi:small subunit ribosomal protein S6
MQRSYEVMFIIRPDLAEEENEKLITTVESNAAQTGVKITATERLGKRRLAYSLRRFNDGFYVLLKVEADGKGILELERRLRVSEPVIKFITVRTDERRKRIDKLAKLRATRVKRSATEAAAPPPPPEADTEPSATQA